MKLFNNFNRTFLFFIISIFLSSTTYGRQSLRVVGGTNGTANITIVQGDLHIDIAYADFIAIPSPSAIVLVNFNGFIVTFERDLGNCGAGDSFRIQDTVDGFTKTIDGQSVSFNNYVCAPIPNQGVSNFAGLRFQRCIHATAAFCTWGVLGGAVGQLQAESWDFTSKIIGVPSTSPIATINPISNVAIQISSADTGGSLAYVRYCQGVLPIGSGFTMSVPPLPNGNIAPPSCNVIADYEFENPNPVNDSGPNHYNLVGLGGGTFNTTPAPTPWCVIQNTSYSLQFPVQLSSATTGTFQDTPTNVLLWSYHGMGSDNITQTPTFSNTTNASPVITNLIPGSFNVDLKCTDTSAQFSIYSAHHGIRNTDLNHNVTDMGNAIISKIYLPAKQWGYNTDPMYDSQVRIMADYFGAFQSTTFFPAWQTPLAGTISCVQGSLTCSTSINVCGNLLPNRFLITHNIDGGVQYYTLYFPNSCTPTQITLSSPYIDSTAGATNINYSVFDGSNGCGGNLCIANWIGPSSNANYYDNVAAFLLLYYTSGIDIYYTYGHTLGLTWWSMPYINKGKSSDSTHLANLNPRIRTQKGLVALFLDGTIPDYYTLIAGTWLFTDEFSLSILTPPIGDLREGSAQLGYVALAALAAPVGSIKSNAQSSIVNAINNFWFPQLLPAGNFTALTFGGGAGLAPWNGNAPGTVTVTNGSPTVVNNTATWANVFANNFFMTWGTNNPTCTLADNYDTTVYFNPAFINNTTITLPSNYVGSNASGRFWQLNNVVGCGTQPFMTGYNQNDMYWVYLSMNGFNNTVANKAKTIITSEATWMKDNAFMGNTQAPAPLGYPVNGIAYWVSTTFVTPDLWHNVVNWCNCDPGGNAPTQIQNELQSTRYISAEIFSGMSWAYYLGNTSIATVGDTMFDATYGGMGGIGASVDPYFTFSYFGGPMTISTDYNIGGATTGGKPKSFGFCCGLGGGSQWNAVRTLAPVNPPAVSIGAARKGSKVSKSVRH